ncbi:MAG: 3' terminal RNA ribose 2'-O-methyltransferase Hen1 [Ktedonobacterales bacterium]|nr:3' terminal RNA ribose 2'-O-methyltransferase Hen1 [Ktedonobacterales bacterium]
MLITLTAQAHDAPDLGYLFAKNPGSVFSRDFSAGRVWVFYPTVQADRITIALLTEIDPIALVRGSVTIDQYVNDRPYVASSLISVALGTAFASALAGSTKEHAERLTERIAWEIVIPVVACDAGADFITRIFAPLGYTVALDQLPLDPHLPSLGASDLFHVTLTGAQTMQDALSHLYVLLPVLDDSKHYYVDAQEVAKLQSHGGTWLARHPERAVIAHRYLRHQRGLVADALAGLAEDLPPATALAADEMAAPVTPDDALPSLHQQRLDAVMAAIHEIGATSLADLGCGEGRLLEMALHVPTLTRILGMDVASAVLARAARRLHLDELSEAQRERIQLIHGSLLYRDRRLAGFDVATLVEVIEHLDPPRLGALAQVVFGQSRPRRVIVTTPNRDYNTRYPLGERLRHTDHRFEWSRAEAHAWADQIVATFSYTVAQRDLGPADPDLGGPSQMLIFDRSE